MERKLTFREWIGVRQSPDYRNARWLGPVVGVLIFLILLTVVYGGVATLFHFLVEVSRADANHEAVRNIGLILIAAIGAPFVVWRAAVAQKQANIAEQQLITDQINKAVDGLGAEKTVSKIGRPTTISRLAHQTERTEIEFQGNQIDLAEGEAVAQVGDWSVFSESSPNIEVRVGAIYALERIAQDSRRDHIQIMETLTAYIRENAPVKGLEPSEPPFNPARPRADVQAALDVIGRRTPESVALEHSQKYRLDLRNVDLSGANFARGNFEGALLFNSRLEASIFRSASLRAARLQGCLLNFADFFDADLCGAVIDRATIDRHNTWGASVALAANTRGLSMAGANVKAIHHLPKDENHCPTFGTKDTILNDHLANIRDERLDDMHQFVFASNGIDIEDETGVTERLAEAGFLHWSPFDSTDLANKQIRQTLWDSLGLVGFPYRD